MLCIRMFEERVVDLVRRGEITGGVHSSLGQEAETVGACMALRPDDFMTGNHRSHGHPIAKGADLKPLMAELLGKRTGVCGGKGGSMHLADFAVGSLGESGIVGSGMPVAVGAGLSAKLRRTGQVCLCFFGDGAVNQGAFHESVNLAAIWKVPVVFVCENNQYAVMTPTSYSVAGGSIADRAKAYGIPGQSVDGQDPETVYEAVQKAANRARVGDGPSLVEAQTYRYRDHAEFGGLQFPPYRPEGEMERWQERDPIHSYRSKLVETGALTADAASSIEDAARALVNEAVAFGRESPYPDLAEAFIDVFATPVLTR
jgi:pyruvate dehydrogenase E1 component alpha subunit